MDQIKKLFSIFTHQKAPSYIGFEESVPKNPEEFKAFHHLIVIKELSKYQDMDLLKIPTLKIKEIGKEFGSMIETSLMNYPNTAECDREVSEIVTILGKDGRFRRSIWKYLYSRHSKMMRKCSKVEKYYREVMIQHICFILPKLLSSWMKIFLNIREGNLPESYIHDVMGL